MPDEFDLESFRKEFEDSYEEPEVVEETDTTETDLEEEVVDEEIETDNSLDSDIEEEVEEEKETDTETELEEKEVPAKKTQTPEENAAFAEMRRKNEALAKQAAIVEKAAAKLGMTVDQYMAAVEEQETAQRAEQQGMTVETLRRLESQEQQLNKLTLDQQRANFFSQVDVVKAKHGLPDDEIKSVFEYIGSNGYVDPVTKLPTISFEDAYKIANFDKVSERKVKEARQKELADKKARQKKSAVPLNNGSTTTNQDSDEITDDFVDKQLQKMGISL